MPKYGIVNTDVLNVRAAPSTTAQILGQLKTNAVVVILADPGTDWLQVQVDGSALQGYVAKTYITQSDTKPSSTLAPASPSTPTAPASPAPATPIGKGEVTTSSLNVRSGPGTNFAVISTLAQGTVVNILQNDGSGWLKVHVGAGDGYVSAQYVNLNTTKTTSGYLIEQPDLLTAPLPPSKIIPSPAPNTTDYVIARTWNNYGGFLSKLATLLGCPVNGVVATLTAESGGTTFGPDGKMIIRFEVHIFWSRWGQNNPDAFNQYFTFDRSSPANGWKGHMFRPNASSPWQGFHGNQALEYQVLTIARALDDTAALSSISMGAPQVMGFNFRRLGYDSVQSMFYQFSRSANAQLLAMFDFVRGTSSSSPAIDALKNRDYLTFANIYNGPANAQAYSTIISNNVAAFDRLIQTAS